MNSGKLNIVFLGPPGAGKGTQAVELSREFDIPHISTGDIFREEMKAETELGKLARSYIDDGNLVPDEVVIRIIQHRLQKDDTRHGYILDGFPRTIPQAEELGEMLRKLETGLSAAIYLEAGPEVIIQRLSGRRVCRKCGTIYHLINMPPSRPGICDKCGGELYQRPDDRPEAIRQRLEQYERKTAGLIKYYQAEGLLKKVDAGIEKEKTYVRLRDILNELK